MPMKDSSFWRVSPLRRIIWAKIRIGSALPPDYKRVRGLRFNNNSFYTITDFYLTGADTVRFTMSVNGACNVFGSYTNSSATTNYSLYASNSTIAKYMRYNGGTYLSGIVTSEYGTVFNVVITPTGSHGLPRNDTWASKTFECETDMFIGTTSASATSASFIGDFYGNFVVDGRFNGIPCKRLSDGVLGYYDTYSKTFYAPTDGSPQAIE